MIWKGWSRGEMKKGQGGKFSHLSREEEEGMVTDGTKIE